MDVGGGRDGGRDNVRSGMSVVLSAIRLRKSAKGGPGRGIGGVMDDVKIMFNGQVHELFPSSIGVRVPPSRVMCIPVSCKDVGGCGVDIELSGEQWDGGSRTAVNIGEDKWRSLFHLLP